MVRQWLTFLLVIGACACDAHADQALEDKKAVANEAIAARNPLVAIRALKDAAALAPNDPSIRWRLGNLYLEFGLPAEAESHLRRAMELGITPSSVLPSLAKALGQQGKHDAVLALDDNADLGPDARALVGAEKALAYLQTGRLSEASEAITIAASGKGDLPRVAVVQARILIEQGERQQAIAQVRGGLERFPQDAELWALLGDLERDLGQGAAADAAYTKAIDLSLSGEYLRILRARLRLDGGDLAGAEEDVAALERIAPATFQSYFLRGRLDLLKGEAEPAFTALQAAMLQDRFSFEALFFAGVAAQATDRRHEAQDLLQRSVSGRPGFLPARYALALLRLDQGRFAEAQSLIEPVVEALPQKEQPMRVLAAVLIAQGEVAGALKLLEQAAGPGEPAPETRFQLGIALMASGQTDRGESVFDQLADMQPSYRAVYEFILSHYLAQGELGAARRWADRFVAERPGSPDPLVWRARVQLAEGQRQAARQTLVGAVELDPKGTAPRYALARMLLAEGDAEAARRQLKAIVDGKTGHQSALLTLAALDAQSENPQSALGWLNQAVWDFPRDPAPLVALARFHLDRGAPQDALSALRARSDELLQYDPDYLRVLGEAEQRSGERQKASLTFRELTRVDPDSAATHYAYARALMALDDRAGAEDALVRSLELDASQDPARLDYVRLLYVEGQYRSAEAALALLKDPTVPEAKLLAGLLAEQADAPDRALALVREVHSAKPTSQTLLILARILARAGRMDEGMRLQQAWLETRPDDTAVRMSLADDLAGRGRVDEALEQYRAIILVAPSNLVALNNLAWHLRDRDPEQALDFAVRAVEIAPRSDGAVDTLAALYAALGRPDDALRTVELGLLEQAGSDLLKLRKARLLLAAGQETDAVKLLVDISRSRSGSEEQVAATKLLDAFLDTDDSAPADGGALRGGN